MLTLNDFRLKHNATPFLPAAVFYKQVTSVTRPSENASWGTHVQSSILWILNIYIEFIGSIYGVGNTLVQRVGPSILLDLLYIA